MIKKLITISISILFALSADSYYSQNLPSINKLDKSFSLYMDKYDNTPLIYGYRLPDLRSEKMIVSLHLLQMLKITPTNVF